MIGVNSGSTKVDELLNTKTIVLWGANVCDLYHPYSRWLEIAREKGVNIISVALDAPGNVISALSGKIGRLDGITAKTVYAPEGSIGKEENQ